MIHAPHLISAASGPLRALETHCLERHTDIEAWLHRRFLDSQAPFYASIDLRNAGWKMAPVDTNLFPAGFNNLPPALAPLARRCLQAAIQRYCPRASQVLLVPENHTRNLYYLDNVARLQQLLAGAGYEVRIGSADPALREPAELRSQSGHALRVEPLQRNGRRLVLPDFDPCVVLLNNDLAGGLPEMLSDVEQPLLPPSSIGWNRRLKSEHFAVYAEVAREFGSAFDLDPWLIDPLWRNCGQVDFMKREGEECIAHNVEQLLASTAEKYAEHDIDAEPYVVIKADAGTYGMGVMVARSVDDVSALNRKQRKAMAATKGRSVSQVILQEGIPTAEFVDGAVAEPVFYCIEQHVVGGFYRVHTDRGADESLNAPGMHFKPFAIDDSCAAPDPGVDCDAPPNRFYAAGVVARLAVLAAAREIERAQQRAA